MPTPEGFADVSLRFDLAAFTRPAYVTFGIAAPSGTSDIITAGAVVAAFQATSSWRSVLDSNVTLTNVRLSRGTASGEDLVYSSPVSIAGSMNLTSLPGNCALLVHKITPRGGRRGKGRMFLPWVISETATDEAGIIGSSDRTILQTAMNNFLAATSTQSVPMVLLHGESGPEVDPPTTPGAPTAVTALSVDPLISTQRRRLGRKS